MKKSNTIYGPPGTGKTRTLVEIAADEAKDARVTFISYTRAAANEAASRIESQNISTSTLHSAAFAAMGANRASVVNKAKLKEFAKVTGVPFQGSEEGAEEQQEGDFYLSALQFARNRLIDPMESYDRFGRPGTSARYRMIVEAYTKWKKTYGYIDFDDMLEQFPSRRMKSPSVVLLDEAQDCSPLQWQVFNELTKDSDRVYIAGDDDQAI